MSIKGDYYATRAREADNEAALAREAIAAFNMTFAAQLDDAVKAIVNGGYLDPLDDDAVLAMAIKIDSGVKMRRYPNTTLADHEYLFTLTFSDGSQITYGSVEE